MRQVRDGILHGRTFTTGTGQRLENIHPATRECWEKGCVIHAPSVHAMRWMPTHWRNDRRFMERVCTHGVGYPDPDQVTYWQRTIGHMKAEMEATHGCDGCCGGAYD